MAKGQDRAKTFVVGVCAVGIACVIAGTIPWQNNDVLQFLCYVALTAIASALKVVLPGLEGTVSVSFIFVLVGVCNMSLSETLALGLTAAIVRGIGAGAGSFASFRSFSTLPKSAFA